MSEPDVLPDIEPLPASNSRKRASNAAHHDNLKKARNAKKRKREQGEHKEMKEHVITQMNPTVTGATTKSKEVGQVAQRPEDQLEDNVEVLVHQDAVATENASATVAGIGDAAAEAEAPVVFSMGGREPDIASSEQTFKDTHDLVKKTGIAAHPARSHTNTPYAYLHPNMPSDQQFNMKGELFSPFYARTGFPVQQSHLPPPGTKMTIVWR